MYILALLDCGTGVSSPSVKTFAQNPWSELTPMLWKGSCPSYLKNIFSAFQEFGFLSLMIFFFIFVITWDPMGVKISKRLFNALACVKIACNSKTAGSRGKLSEICESGIVVTCMPLTC